MGCLGSVTPKSGSPRLRLVANDDSSAEPAMKCQPRQAAMRKPAGAEQHFALKCEQIRIHPLPFPWLTQPRLRTHRFQPHQLHQPGNSFRLTLVFYLNLRPFACWKVDRY